MKLKIDLTSFIGNYTPREVPLKRPSLCLYISEKLFLFHIEVKK